MVCPAFGCEGPKHASRRIKEFGLLVMPTIPFRARAMPASGCSREDDVGRALDMVANTCRRQRTSAINVPCGLEGGLPIGLMLVGRRYDEDGIVSAARAFEKLCDWKETRAILRRPAHGRDEAHRLGIHDAHVVKPPSTNST